MTFKNKIRKIVGDCFNQVAIDDECLVYPHVTVFTGNSSRPDPTAHAFRIISGWHGVREDFLKLINVGLDSDQLAANAHLWPSSWRRTLKVSNPANYPVRFKLYKMTLKCDDTGPTPGLYNQETASLPFGDDGKGSGSANYDGSGTGVSNVTANSPWGFYWKFFDQSSRQGLSSAVTGMEVNPMLCTNQDGTYSAPMGETFNTTVNGGGSYNWESRTQYSTGVWFDPSRMFSTPLSFIYPNIRKKLKIRCVASGKVGAYSHRTFSWRNRIPKELRPNDWISDSKPNFIGNVSHFYFIRAVGSRRMRFQSEGLNVAGRTSGNRGPGNNQLPVYLEPTLILPPQLRLRSTDTISFRAAGDGKPTFLICSAGQRLNPNGFASSTSIWISNQGWIESGEGEDATYDEVRVPFRQCPYMGVPDGDLVATNAINLIQ